MAKQHHHPQQLGHYRLLRLLGQGGFAEVYLGEHIHLNTPVAVKILHTRLQENDMQDFRREAQTVARLIHPNIVRVLDFGVEQSVPYLVMDFAPNGTLRQRHPKGTHLPLHVVALQAGQIAEALQYAHDQRLIHRDIKPENMLLGANNTILLSDFGLALLIQSSSYSSAQSIAGTIAYMAPEQIQAHPTPASDQYALGVVVYEWLCGRRPFEGSYTEIAVKHSITPPPPLRSWIPDLPTSVEQVVLTALQKEPGQRHPSIRAFAQAFIQAVEQVSDAEQHIPTMIKPSSTNTSMSFISTLPTTKEPAVRVEIQEQPHISHTPAPPFHTPSSFAEGSVHSTPHISHTSTPNTPTWTPPVSTGQPGTYPPSLYPPFPQKPARHFSRRTMLIGGTVGAIALGVGGALWWQTPGTLQEKLNRLIPGGSSLLPEQTFKDHDGLVLLVGWSPNGKYIASGSYDTTLKIWTADTAELQLSVRSRITPPQTDNYPWSLTWSPSNLLAVCFNDGTIQVLDPVGQKMVNELQTPLSTVSLISWSPDEKYMAVSTFTDGIHICAYPSWEVLRTYTEHTDSLNALKWSPDGKYIASGASDTTVRIWNPHTNETIRISDKHSDDIASLSWSPDSKYVVTSSQDERVVALEIETGRVLFNLKRQSGAPMGQVVWSHTGKYIALYDGHAQVDLLDAATGDTVQTFHTGVVYGLSWSPDDRKLVVGCYENQAQIWPVK